MDEISSKLKRIREIRCECVDEATLSPNVRARKVYNSLDLSELDNWSLICFSVLTLASQLAIVPDLKQEVESLSLKIMRAHYFQGGDFGLYDESAIHEIVKTRIEMEINKEVSKNDLLKQPESPRES